MFIPNDKKKIKTFDTNDINVVIYLSTFNILPISIWENIYSFINTKKLQDLIIQYGGNENE